VRLGGIPARTTPRQRGIQRGMIYVLIHPALADPSNRPAMIPWIAIPGHALSSCPQMAIDSPRSRVYIDGMADNVNATFEHELKRLEKRVDALVRVCDQLQDENKSLKQRQDVLTAERASLLQKNEQVRARVEAMIGRLKAMEQGS
jgi:cell division protein ZapB